MDAERQGTSKAQVVERLILSHGFHKGSFFWLPFFVFANAQLRQRDRGGIGGGTPPYR